MTNLQNLITNNIDIWTSAIKKRSATGRGSSKKIELTGVKKLRELILDLAVRGKLLSQDQNDDSVSKLLKSIDEEKAELIKNKELKRSKVLPDLLEDECTFDLPESWLWCRLGNVCKKLTDGSHNPPSNSGVGFPMLSCQNVNYGKVDFSSPSRYVTEEDFHQENKRTKIQPNDVLLSIVASIGRSAVVPDDAPKFVLQRSVAVLQSQMSPFYFSYMLTSPLCINYYNTHAKGTAQKGIYLGKLSLMPLAIPPLAEQHRIVTKVDELMVLCDQLEQQTEKSISAHQALVNVLLNTLTASADAQEFSQNWKRIAEHFDTLFTTEYSIEQLKQTILQLAVMGKLVPQVDNDEPASVLLERISAVKEQLLADKTIKKQKALPEISEDEKSFVLPKGWNWVRLQDITSKITDGDHQTPPRIDAGKRLLSAKNVRDGFLDFENCDFISDEHFNKSRERCLPEKGDLLIVSVGGTIGRSSLVPNDSDFALVRSVALIKPLLFNTQFFKYAADGPLLQSSIHANKRGGAQPCLYLSEISKFPFPLPPLEEQGRIVDKLDEMMNVCNHLTTQISNNQNTKINLAEALVKQGLSH